MERFQDVFGISTFARNRLTIFIIAGVVVEMRGLILRASFIGQKDSLNQIHPILRAGFIGRQNEIRSSGFILREFKFNVRTFLLLPQRKNAGRGRLKRSPRWQ